MLDMSGLWNDGWFYISSAGFLISSVLFLFLLGQYRAAVEAADEPQDSLPPKPLSLEPVVTSIVPLQKTEEKKSDKTLILPPEPTRTPVAAAVPAPVVAPAPAPAPAAASPLLAASGPAYSGPDRRRGSESTSSGQISPAVVYLQNIKEQMEKFDKEIGTLKSLTSQQTAQNDLILRKLSELQALAAQPVQAVAPVQVAAPPAPVDFVLDATEALGSALSAPGLAPAPAPAPAASPVDSSIPAAAFAAAISPVAASDATMAIERFAPPPKAAPTPAPEPAQPPQPTTPLELKIDSFSAPKDEPVAAEAPKRKGPVWPV